MDKTKVTMILITITCIIGVSGLIGIRLLINYCETTGDPTDKLDPCYDPNAFCMKMCEENGDYYIGNYSKYECYCKNGLYTTALGKDMYLRTKNDISAEDYYERSPILF